jgi:hypothetical protein
VSEQPAVIYLEADDEVTSVVRRLRAAEPGPVILVTPGRSRATSSVVALRLLARAGSADDRPVSVVGDALTRSLAAEAGLPAFATLDDARRAELGAPAPTTEPQHASISVVRGPVTDDTAPTLAAVPLAPDPADDVTRPVPVIRPASQPRGRALAAVTRRSLPVALVGAIAAVLVAALVAAAVVLPAATVTLTPRSAVVGPVTYTIEADDTERRSGTATATAEVTATGTYAIQQAASGAVVLYNWTFFPVDVPAGTFVAAGEQAFATQADVVVPRGRLTQQGTIAAGDAEVGVVAAAAGPAANVDANAINVVVNEDVDARLRGFPENPEPRVLNPAPTTGGVDTTGPEITQADVDAAVEALRQDLAAQAADAVAPAGDPDEILLAPDLPEPTLAGIEGLAGTRDQERAEINGELPWEAFVADRASVVAMAEERFVEDGSVLPDGHELLAGSIDVTAGEASLDGEVIHVEVNVAARAAPAVDRAVVMERIGGLTAPEAEAALADLGGARVELWPGWVSTVPDMDWRVDVRIAGPDEAGGTDST